MGAEGYLLKKRTAETQHLPVPSCPLPSALSFIFSHCRSFLHRKTPDTSTTPTRIHTTHTCIYIHIYHTHTQHMHTHTGTPHTCTHIHYTCTQTHHKHTCTHAYAYPHTYQKCTHTHVHTTHAYTHIHMHTDCTRTHMHIHTPCTNMRACTYMYITAHTHTLGAPECGLVTKCNIL